MIRHFACVLLCVYSVTAEAQSNVAPKKPVPKPVASKPAGPAPISVDPINPRYLRFRGRPIVLITSGEHYGAVLNSAFDYVKYLDTLHEAGMNLVRIIDGTHVDLLDSAMFPGGDQNTLAPRAGSYLAPWARTGAPGYAGGGRKFDLTQWDNDYFTRLKSFVAEAGKRDIAVEVTLFNSSYGSGKSRWGSWNLNPLNAANNINGVGDIAWDRLNTLENAGVVAAQDALVKKTAAELNAFDNVYYEICNEPWFSGASRAQTRDWLNHIIATLATAEAALPNKHLIAGSVFDSNPAVSIYNFHSPNVNWSLRKPVAIDATSNGCATLDRRREAWTFVFSGGAVYNNLDLAFMTDNPAGKSPDVNCDGVRYALRILAQFVNGLDLGHMQPDPEAVSQWLQYASEIHMLTDPGRVYALYLKGGNDTRATTLLLDASAGRYQIDWLNPRTGESARDAAIDHNGGPLKLTTPEYTEDLAMKMVRVGDLPAAKPVVSPKPKGGPGRKTR
jgi:hypothetical protein